TADASFAVRIEPPRFVYNLVRCIPTGQVQSLLILYLSEGLPATRGVAAFHVIKEHEVTTNRLALRADVTRQRIHRALRSAALDQPSYRASVPVAPSRDHVEVERNSGGQRDYGSLRDDVLPAGHPRCAEADKEIGKPECVAC